jgi:DNA repair protein RadA/Sms
MIELSTDQIKFLKETSSNSSLGSVLSKAKPITQIEEDNVTRFPSGSAELDLVLGGGVVPGSLTLIGGSPGIGKSLHKPIKKSSMSQEKSQRDR